MSEYPETSPNHQPNADFIDLTGLYKVVVRLRYYLIMGVLLGIAGVQLVQRLTPQYYLYEVPIVVDLNQLPAVTAQSEYMGRVGLVTTSMRHRAVVTQAFVEGFPNEDAEVFTTGVLTPSGKLTGLYIDYNRELDQMVLAAIFPFATSQPAKVRETAIRALNNLIRLENDRAFTVFDATMTENLRLAENKLVEYEEARQTLVGLTEGFMQAYYGIVRFQNEVARRVPEPVTGDLKVGGSASGQTMNFTIPLLDSDAIADYQALFLEGAQGVFKATSIVAATVKRKGVLSESEAQDLTAKGIAVQQTFKSSWDALRQQSAITAGYHKQYKQLLLDASGRFDKASRLPSFTAMGSFQGEASLPLLSASLTKAQGFAVFALGLFFAIIIGLLRHYGASFGVSVFAKTKVTG